VPQTELFVFIGRIVTSGGPTYYLWAETSGGNQLLRTDDGGVNYVVLAPPFLAPGTGLDPGDPWRLFAVSLQGEVHLSTDGGVSWTLRSAGLPADDGLDVFLDPADPDRVVVVYENAGVWQTSDGGLDWTLRAAGPGSPVKAAEWDPVHDRVFLATVDDGVWIGDLGFVNGGLETRDLVALDYLPGEDVLILATDHAGALALALPPQAVAAPAPARETATLRIYPTPFTSRLTVAMDLPALGASSEVKVYDVAGHLVATLLPEGVRSGKAMVSWDGRDRDGRAVAPGAYFVTGRIAGERWTRRAVLVR
jgi:hypothetical protein